LQLGNMRVNFVVSNII